MASFWFPKSVGWLKFEDILTWTEAFTIYQMVICASHPHRWSDLTKYKLLIIQTACHSPGCLWLEYDVAFWKDVAATGASDWSRMNLDIYNFHLCSPASSPLHYHRPLARPYRSQLLKEAVPVPRTVIHGTEASAFGLLEIAAFATHAAHVKETTLGSAAHSIPLAPSTPAPPPSISGSAVHGQHLSNPCLLRTRSSFPLLWLHTCKVLNGLLGGSSSCATMSWWWLFCLLAPPETQN